MNEDLATHISLLAAPIYAAFLMQRGDAQDQVSSEYSFAVMRKEAVTQALALWRQTLEIHTS